MLEISTFFCGMRLPLTSLKLYDVVDDTRKLCSRRSASGSETIPSSTSGGTRGTLWAPETFWRRAKIGLERGVKPLYSCDELALEAEILRLLGCGHSIKRIFELLTSQRRIPKQKLLAFVKWRHRRGFDDKDDIKPDGVPS
jgi:hypothetical protein